MTLIKEIISTPTRLVEKEVIREIASGGVGGSGTVEADGGDVRDGEPFSLFLAAGGLTGETTMTIGGISCTSVVVVDDFNMTAVAPADDLLHNTSYSLVTA